MSDYPPTIDNRTGNSAFQALSDRTRQIEARTSYLMFGYKGKPADADVQSVLFPVDVGFEGAACIAVAKVAAAAPKTFTLKLEGVTVGTVSFAVGQTTGIVSTTLANIPALDEFEVIAPSPQDATLSGVTLAFAIQR